MNNITTTNTSTKAIKEAAEHMPDGIKYYYHYDSSEFVLLSIQAVISTLLIAFVLVFVVVMLFIQNIRGTIIPVLAIPVSIIGAFAGTYALGFSINTMTLFGMVLAIGIVVDDAIVVLECVEKSKYISLAELIWFNTVWYAVTIVPTVTKRSAI